MTGSVTSFDPDTLSILTRAFDAAWLEVGTPSPSDFSSGMATTRKIMALRILTAAEHGERCVVNLAALAVRAVQGRGFN